MSRGFAVGTVWRYLRARGLGRTRAEANRLRFLRRHADVVDVITEAYLAGSSVLALSKRHGLDRGTVGAILDSQGIECRGGSDAIGCASVTPRNAGGS